MATDSVIFTGQKGTVLAKTDSQKQYVATVNSHDITFGLGPAGTGKTFVAVAMAVNALANKQVGRLVFARPAVEAGEKLGFLPGDMAEKVNPYLRPLFDALHDMMDADKIKALMDRQIIEIAPLAFMRGRTLSNSFVILDEAQNTTIPQMKMLLTRMGHGSKMVITGDPTQVDLASNTSSGLEHAVSILGPVEGIGISRFTDADVVRHPLVARIIRAYEEENRSDR